MKKFICIFTLFFIFIAIAGCASSTPPQKTEVNVTPPAANVTPTPVIVTPTPPQKVEVNVTPPAPPATPK